MKRLRGWDTCADGRDEPCERFARFASAVAGAALTFVGAIAPAVFADVVPIPDVTGPIPEEGDSHPFNAADRQVVPVDLSEYGYVEEEYFLSGLANVYEWDVPFETVRVRTPDAPYTNRILRHSMTVTFREWIQHIDIWLACRLAGLCR